MPRVCGLVLVLVISSSCFAEAGWRLLSAEPARNPGLDAAGIPQIFDGVPTGDYPAVAGVAVLLDGGVVASCTGTLISPSVVITAAHCVASGPLAIATVFFPGGGSTGVQYDVVQYAIEPEFSPDVLAVADIALLLLESPVAGVTPMPLATKTPRPGTKSTIVGYGQDETGRVGLKEFGTIRLKKCPRMFNPAGLVRRQLSRSLCWRPKQRHQDTCHGDSGGPLLAKSALAGVTSGGYPDCPGILSWDTNVVPFLPWITPLLR
jgi:hypothetical protein